MNSQNADDRRKAAAAAAVREDGRLAFIERFASALTDSGMPRMPARAFAALLATDSGHLTAAELADVLQASPAAISGAVRYLTQVNLATREREPGSRRDRFRVHDGDLWYESVARRDQFVTRWSASLEEGVNALGADTPAGARLAETLAFFEFLHVEMGAMLDRWRALKKASPTPRGRRSAS